MEGDDADDDGAEAAVTAHEPAPAVEEGLGEEGEAAAEGDAAVSVSGSPRGAFVQAVGHDGEDSDDAEEDERRRVLQFPIDGRLKGGGLKLAALRIPKHPPMMMASNVRDTEAMLSLQVFNGGALPPTHQVAWERQQRILAEKRKTSLRQDREQAEMLETLKRHARRGLARIERAGHNISAVKQDRARRHTNLQQVREKARRSFLEQRTEKLPLREVVESCYDSPRFSPRLDDDGGGGDGSHEAWQPFGPARRSPQRPAVGSGKLTTTTTTTTARTSRGLPGRAPGRGGVRAPRRRATEAARPTQGRTRLRPVGLSSERSERDAAAMSFTDRLEAGGFSLAGDEAFAQQYQPPRHRQTAAMQTLQTRIPAVSPLKPRRHPVGGRAASGRHSLSPI